MLLPLARENVAEHLGFATAATIKSGDHTPTLQQLDAVQAWIADCDIAWIECESKRHAKALERELKKQQLPQLTKL